MPGTEKKKARDRERMKRIRSEIEAKKFTDSMAAYIRGANWVLEGMQQAGWDVPTVVVEGLNKAAYDYADKSNPPLSKAQKDISDE